MYHDGPDFRSNGVHLEATTVPTPGLDLIIQPDVTMQWPSVQNRVVDVGRSTISWDAFAGADRYQLQLHRTEKDGDSTSYFPVAWVNTIDTQIPLSGFETVRGKQGGDSEDAVRVFAFNGNGELLSTSGRFFNGPSFVLRGETIVETDELRSLDNLSERTPNELHDQFETRRRDKKRLAAARTLMAEGMADAASVIVDRVESPSLMDEKTVIMAMILAGNGRCEEARTLLDVANNKRGRECYPAIFTERCETASATDARPRH